MEALERYRNHNTSSADPKKGIAFYDRIGRDGITDHAVRVSAERFRDVFARWNERLGGFPFLLGDTLTIDIADPPESMSRTSSSASTDNLNSWTALL